MENGKVNVSEPLVFPKVQISFRDAGYVAIPNEEFLAGKQAERDLGLAQSLGLAALAATCTINMCLRAKSFIKTYKETGEVSVIDAVWTAVSAAGAVACTVGIAMIDKQTQQAKIDVPATFLAMEYIPFHSADVARMKDDFHIQ